MADVVVLTNDIAGYCPSRIVRVYRLLHRPVPPVDKSSYTVGRLKTLASSFRE